MKSLFALIFVALTLFLYCPSHAQVVSDKTYVKIIVEGVPNSQEARALDQFIRTKNGVLTSRMDVRTNLYFGIYTTTSGVTNDDFEEWISTMGYTPRCAVHGEYGQGNMLELKASDCPKVNPQIPIETDGN